MNYTKKVPGGWMSKAFTTGDMRSVPIGWRTGPPNFVGVGSGSAGTTWWYNLLLEHPNIVANRLESKELQYFYHFGYHDPEQAMLETYRLAFAAPANHVCGEWSPGYLFHPFAIDYLKQAAPNTKIIAIIRNPIDRFFSVLNRTLTRRTRFLNLDGEKAYVFKTYSLFPAAAANCLYADAFRRLLNKFDRSQILVLQYERCKQDPAEEISRTYKFLQVESSYRPRLLTTVINPSSHSLPKLLPEERIKLANYFYEDVSRLVNMFPELDISLWPDLAG